MNRIYVLIAALLMHIVLSQSFACDIKDSLLAIEAGYSKAASIENLNQQINVPAFEKLHSVEYKAEGFHCNQCSVCHHTFLTTNHNRFSVTFKISSGAIVFRNFLYQQPDVHLDQKPPIT